VLYVFLQTKKQKKVSVKAFWIQIFNKFNFNQDIMVYARGKNI